MKRGQRISIAVIVLVLISLMTVACGGSKEYTLTFETNGGSTVAAITAKAGDDITPPANPTRSGYTFGGWYEDADFSGEAVTIPDKMPKGNKTYYAKWNEVISEVTLHVGNGGTYDGETTFKGTPGATVSSLIKNPTPKTGLTFDGWFKKIGEQYVALQPSETLPGNGIELYARYTLTVNITVYRQGVDGTYPTTGEQVAVSGYFEEAYTYSPEANFTLDAEKENVVTTDSLTLDTALSAYLKRRSYTLTYNMNYPENVSGYGIPATVSALYEQQVTLATDESLTLTGDDLYLYKLRGWASTANATQIEYRMGEEYQVLGNVTLYAVWERGASSRMDTSDVLFIVPGEDNSRKAILVRGGYEFEGTVLPGGTFRIAHGDKVITGGYETGASGSYFYFDSDCITGDYRLKDGYAYLEGEEVPESLYSDSVTLSVAKNFTATLTYAETTENPETTINGEVFYVRDTEEYIFIGTDESYLGYTVSFRIGEDELSGGSKQKYITIRGGEADGTGSYVEFITPDGSRGRTGTRLIALDGYNTITLIPDYTSPDEAYEGSYHIMQTYFDPTTGGVLYYYINGYVKADDEQEKLDGMDENGILLLSMVVYPSQEIFIVRSDNFYGAFAADPDQYVGGSAEPTTDLLTLSGFGVIPSYYWEVTSGGIESYVGTYTYIDSKIHGRIVTFQTGTGSNFVFKIVSDQTVGEGGRVTPGKFEKLTDFSTDFSEYVLFEKGDDGKLKIDENSVMLVESDARSNPTKATLYSFGGESFAQTDTGAITTDYTISSAASGVYFYTMAGSQATVKFTLVEGLALGDKIVNAYIVLSTQAEGADPTLNYEELECDGNGDKMWVIFSDEDYTGIGAYYFETITGGNNVYMGTFFEAPGEYFTDNTYGSFIYATTSGITEIPVSITTVEGKKKFTPIDGELALRSYNGFVASEEPELILDGSVIDATGVGKAIYKYNDGEARTVNGTYKLAELSTQTFTFTSDDEKLTFDFRAVRSDLSGGQALFVYFRYNEKYNATFSSGRDTLRLDGYHVGTWSSSTMGTYTGEYFEIGNNTILLKIADTYFYFEVSGTEFVLLDSLAGGFDFELVDESLHNYKHGGKNVIAKCDGKGKIELFEQGAATKFAEGTYELRYAEDMTFNVKVTVDGETKEFAVMVSNDGGERSILIVYDSKLEAVFADADTNVILLDGFGAIYRLDANGNVAEGTYEVISDESGIVTVRATFVDPLTQQFTVFTYTLNLEDSSFTEAA